jgi:hypothetical protein
MEVDVNLPTIWKAEYSQSGFFLQFSDIAEVTIIHKMI